MNQEHKQKPILIYFKTRGNAQMIRCVLLQVGMEFEEIFIPFHGVIDQNIMAQYKIEIKNLPYFIDGGVTLQGVFPIIKYICNMSGRTDLIGKNLNDQITVVQLITKLMRQQSVLLTVLFKGLKEIKDKGLGPESRNLLQGRLLESIQRQKHVHCVRNMFETTKSYFLGYLTILDFFVYQKTFCGTNIVDKNCQFMQSPIAYVKFFQSTDFFKKHKEALSKYKIFIPEMSCELNEILKQVWQGDPKFITCD